MTAAAFVVAQVPMVTPPFSWLAALIAALVLIAAAVLAVRMGWRPTGPAVLAGAALAALAGLVWGGAESLGIPVGTVVLLVVAMLAMAAGALR